LLIEPVKKRREILKNFREYLPKIKSAVKDVIGDVEIYVFGSILEGEFVGGSDVDIMIVADVESNRKRAEVLAEIEERIGLPLSHPFEFHLLTKDEFDKWISIFKPKLKKL